MRNKVDIIGPYPPPFGGVSIHISRMLPLMRDAGLTPVVYNQYDYEDASQNIFATKKSLMWWLTYIFKRKSPVVHIHQFSWIHFPYILLLSWTSKNKYILSIHNEKILSYSPSAQFVIYSTLKISRLSCLIVVSKTLHAKLEKNRVKNIEWLPAYVPPSKSLQLVLPGQHSTKVVFNAAQLSNLKAIETYGADHLLRLAKDHPEIGFYIFAGEPSSEDFFNKYLSDFEVGNCTVFYGKPLVEYLASANYFLRLNREDAYGISIDEALDLGVPALASDVCSRAEGCIVYKKGDYSDLLKTFNQMLIQNNDDQLKSRKPSKFHNHLISIYKKLLNSTP